MEEARAFQRMLDNGYLVEQLAREIGVQTHRIRYRLQLITLDPTIQTMLAKGQISSPMAHEIGPSCRVPFVVIDGEVQMSKGFLGAAMVVAFVTLGGAAQSAVLRIDKPPTLGLVEPVVCMGDRRTYRNFDHCWRVLARYPWGARYCSRICR